jgi:arylsulfatase
MFAPKFFKSDGSFNHTPTHVMDIAPTIYQMASAQYPKVHKGKKLYPIQGMSLLKVLNEVEERTLYFEHEGNRAIRQGKWKALWVNYKKS